MGHAHVCEALGIRESDDYTYILHCNSLLTYQHLALHIMFPQPWHYPTGDYPHPLSGLEYTTSNEAKSGTSAKMTYGAIEALMWSSTGVFINKWRTKKLQLPRVLDGARVAIPESKVPFSGKTLFFKYFVVFR